MLFGCSNTESKQRDMQVEVTAAINLIAGSLYNKLPRRRVDAFAEELEKGIITKFQGHWYPENPSKGAAYRCINVSGEKVDPVIIYSIMNSGLDIEEVNTYLPKDLTIWIDPGEVSFSIGEKGQVKLLYSERRSASNSSDESSSKSPTNGFNALPQSSAAMSPVNFPEEGISSLASSFGTLNLSSPAVTNTSGMISSSGWGTAPSSMPWPNSATNNNNLWGSTSQKPVTTSPWSMTSGFNNNQSASTFPLGAPISRSSNTNNKTMTAAMFAQTKFGSTKLKTQAKRSNRLSPTDNFPRNLQGQHSFAVGSRPMQSNINQTLADRMQLHLQQSNNFENGLDQFKGLSINNHRLDSFNNLPNNNNSMNAFNGSMGRFSPFTLGSLTGLTSPTPDQDWVDLTDMNVQPSANQLLAT